MRFSLDNDQSMLCDAVRRMLDSSYAFEARQQALAATRGLDRQRWAQFVEMGLIGLDVDVSDGGLGLSLTEAMLVHQELGRALVVEPVLACETAASLLRRHAPRQLRAALVSRVIAGEGIIVVAHGEPNCSGLPGKISTSAVRAPGGGFLLSGLKSVVLGGSDADILLVSARIVDRAGNVDGLALFLLPTDTPGVVIAPLELTDGRRAADVTMTDVTLSADACLVHGVEGASAVAFAFDRYRMGLCAEMVGAMDRAIMLVCKYLPVRRQFGQPLTAFQALRHRVADMHVELEQARSALFAGLAAMRDDNECERHVAVTAAKAQIGFAARFVGGNAVQLHGGIGMTEEYAVGHYFKRLSVCDALLGNADSQLAMLANALAEQDAPPPPSPTDQSVDSSPSLSAE